MCWGLSPRRGVFQSSGRSSASSIPVLKALRPITFINVFAYVLGEGGAGDELEKGLVKFFVGG